MEVYRRIRSLRIHKKQQINIKTQQRFRSEKHNVFTGETNQVDLSSNNGKIIQSMDSIATYTYGASKDLVCKKGEINCNNMTQQNKNV